MGKESIGPPLDLLFLAVGLIDEHEGGHPESAVVGALPPEEVLGAARAEIIAVIAEADECYWLILEVNVRRTFLQ